MMMASLIKAVELTDKDENGFQRLTVWHESGAALATLKVESWAKGLDGAGKEFVMCDLLDVLQDGLASETGSDVENFVTGVDLSDEPQKPDYL